MQNGEDVLSDDVSDRQSGVDPDIHLVRRTGAPPLRIRGHIVCQHSAGGAHADLWISLWTLARIGFVVHCAHPIREGAQTIAARVETLAAANEWLEQQCVELNAQDTTSGDLIAALHEQHFKWRVERFLQLAGSAMAEWPAKVRDL